MSITVTRQDDRLIAIKRGDPDDPGRLRREADLLAHLEHPGLVPFIELVEGDPPELHTAYVGTDTWARTPPTTSAEIVEGLALAASTVADLHDYGMAHRSLLAEHVIVAGDHRPVLCGMANTTPLDPLGEADDMAGLAELIRHLASGATPDLRAALEDLAEEASTGRLDARSLTDRLDALPADRASHSNRRWRVRRRIAGVLAVAAAVAFAILASSPASAPEPGTAVASTGIEQRRVSPTAPPRSSTTRAPGTTDTPPSTSIPSTSMPSTSMPPAAPASTGPAVAIEFVHDGRLYGLGGPADVAVLGDWNCDGVETPALLQPESGVVAIFATWPEPGTAVTPTATTLAPAAIALEAVEQVECHQLRILEPDGSQLFAMALS